MTRRMRLCAAGVLVAVALTGCAPRARGSLTAEVKPDTATRRTSSRDGLEFSAEVASDSVVAGDALVVRLRLRNVSGGRLRWDDVRFGLSVTTTRQPDPNAPDGMFIGLDSGTYTPGRTRLLHPLVLDSGEATTVVRSTGVTAATWQVVGSYAGDEGEPSGQSPTITVVARPRR